jgi:hypothetical protein
MVGAGGVNIPKVVTRELKVRLCFAKHTAGASGVATNLDVASMSYAVDCVRVMAPMQEVEQTELLFGLNVFLLELHEVASRMIGAVSAMYSI